MGVQGDGHIISSDRALGTALNASALDAAMLRKLGQQQPQGSSRLSAMLTHGGESLMVHLKAALRTAPLFRTPSQVKLITSVMLATHFFQTLEPADLDAISRRLLLEKVNPNKIGWH